MDNFSNNTIDISSLPQFENVEFQQVSRKYLVKSNIQTGIFMIVLLSIWGGFLFYGANQYSIWISLFAILLYFSFRFWNNYKLQENYGYAVREKDIMYRRGFMVSSTTVIPLNRIQHVSISRDVLDKMLDISSVQVFTAGGSGSDISIPGLDPQLAVQVKEALAAKLSENGD